MFDLTDRDSFAALGHYARQLEDATRDCMVVLVGTKLDLVLLQDPGAHVITAGGRLCNQEVPDDSETLEAQTCEAGIEPKLIERQVSREEAEAYASTLGAIYFETSSKEGISVSSVFDAIGAKLLSDRGAPPARDPLWVQPTMVVPERTKDSSVCCTIQ